MVACTSGRERWPDPWTPDTYVHLTAGTEEDLVDAHAQMRAVRFEAIDGKHANAFLTGVAHHTWQMSQVSTGLNWIGWRWKRTKQESCMVSALERCFDAEDPRPHHYERPSICNNSTRRFRDYQTIMAPFCNYHKTSRDHAHIAHLNFIPMPSNVSDDVSCCGYCKPALNVRTLHPTFISPRLTTRLGHCCFILSLSCSPTLR